jgi:hypothetical protein
MACLLAPEIMPAIVDIDAFTGLNCFSESKFAYAVHVRPPAWPTEVAPPRWQVVALNFVDSIGH